MREVDTDKINVLMYLETQLSNRIKGEIEELLRGKEIDPKRIEESLNYVIEEQLCRIR